jgi:hypothetical protein
MFVALLSMMLVASEDAAATVAENPPVVANQAADPEKKICKRQAVTGQLQGTKRVCMTAEQWKRVQEAADRTKR